MLSIRHMCELFVHLKHQQGLIVKSSDKYLYCTEILIDVSYDIKNQQVMV